MITRAYWNYSFALLLLSSLPIALPARADNQWSPPGHGYVISVITPQGISQNSGSPAQITGTITFVGDSHGKPDSNGKCHNGKANGKTKGKGKGKNKWECPPLASLLDQLKEDGISITASFPDSTVDVTSQVLLTGHPENIQFSFTSPKLSRLDLNRFSIQLSHPFPEMNGLLQVQSKLDFRIKLLTDLIYQLSTQGTSPQDLAELKAFRDRLATISARITAKLQSHVEIASQAVLPLQVDNILAGNGMNSSIQGHFRIEIISDLGTAIEGLKTQFHTTITHLPGFSSDDGETDWDFEDGDRFVARFIWKELQIAQLNPQAIPEGRSVQYDYATGKLVPEGSNIFTAELYSWDASDGLGKKFGSLSYAEPVADDSISPTWLAGSTPDLAHPYVKVAQPISAQVQDLFGLNDGNKFKATLTGTLTTGPTQNLDITSQIQFSSPDNGQTFLASGNLNPLADGFYVLSLHDQDSSGNSAVPDPLKSQFRIDTAPPSMTLSQSGSACTSLSQSNVTATVTDWSPLTTTVTNNGAQIIQKQASPSSLTNQLTQIVPIQIDLSAGNNAFSVTSLDAAGNTVISPATFQIFYDPNAPGVSLSQADHIYTNQKAFSFTVNTSDIGVVTNTAYHNGVQVLQTSQNTFTVSETLTELNNTFEIDSINCAGLKTVVKLNAIYLDDIAPTIALGASGPILTRMASFQLPITVTDATSTNTVVTQNGTQIAQSAAPSFAPSATLHEGLNVFVVTATDQANNTSSVTLGNVVLDTTSPVLSNVSPANGATLTSLTIPVSFSAGEALSLASVNSTALTLASNGKSATGSFTAQTSGPLTLVFRGTDLAGNVTTASNTINISLSALNGNLISVVPETDGAHLNIVGAMGSAIPGMTINAAAGFFNSGSAVSAADGSFKIALFAFQSATVSATDSATGQSSSLTVTWGSGGSVLSGSVKDTSGNPLAGATVSFATSTIPPVTTQPDGTFSFTQPVTGAQQLIIDGTTVPTTGPNGALRKFSKTSISVNIGLSQTNVLQHPIYLVPTPLDGTIPMVTAFAGGTVTSPAAPGASLEIPALSAAFPGGVAQAPISLTTIPAQFSTVPPMSFAVPDTVLAMEPSGTTFSKPVTLTMPNDNALPPGTEMLVMSMNSLTGRWEIGGVGAVSDDGQNVTTLPGQGITHFSIVYFTPTFDAPKEAMGTDSPSTDSFNGVLSKSVLLPSYKVLGQDFAPTLLYNSSWAKPNAFVSNLFDLTPMKINIGVIQTGVLNYTAKSCFLFICSDEPGQAFWSSSYQAVSWYQPRLITAQFITGAFQSPLLSFSGNPLMPARSIVSYHMPLKDTATDEFLPSGVYPYRAKYQLHLDHLVIGTKTTPKWNGSFFQGVQESLDSDTQLDQVFPADLDGTLVVDNQTHSAMGKGWKVAGVQKLVNPENDRILIQEGDGSSSTFVIDNVMNTLYQGVKIRPCGFFTSCSLVEQDSPFSEATVLGQWPTSMFIQYKKTGQFVDASGIHLITDGNIELTSHNLTTGIATGTKNYPAVENFGSPSQGILSGLVRLPNGDVYVSTSNNAIYKRGGLNVSIRTVAGPPVGFGGVGANPGFNGDGSISSPRALNNPTVMLVGPRPNSLVFADTGNNRVRLVDFTANTIETIAGNGQALALDVGDGGPATQASLTTPRGLAYDSVGNLYIGTENGVIRKVDTTGRISTFAGKPTGYYADKTPAALALFNSPRGLVVDNLHGYLYVADTGQHRVVRIDFATMSATTVAGDGSPGDSDDGDAALEGRLSSPTSLSLDPDFNLIIADTGNRKIKQVVFSNGASPILTFASVKAATPGARQNSDGTWVPFLQKNADGSWTRNYRNGSIVTFNSQGLELSAIDPIGNRTNFGYDTLSNLTSITDPTQRTLVFNYTGNLLTSVVDPAGRSTLLSYGTHNTLTGVQFPDTTTKHFGYDSSGIMISETDQRGNMTSYTYNQYDRLTSVILPSGASVKVSDAGSLTALNNATGGVAVPALAYGTNIGNAANTTTDPNGNTTTISKNYYGFIETIKDPLGNKTEMQTDEFGHPTQATAPDGAITTLTYNDWFDVVSQTNSSTHITTSQIFNNYGNLMSSTNGRGYTTTYSYYPNNLIKNKVDALNRVTQYVYNNFGQPVTVIDSLNHQRQNGYDVVGNQITSTDPLNHTTIATYDLAGNVLTTKDANGNVTTYTYDSFNRLLSVLTAKGAKTQYGYLATGQLSTVTDPLGNITTYNFDALGRMTSKSDSLGYVTQNSYDSNGNLTQSIDPNGNIRTIHYDALNRPTQQILPDNTVNLGYDFRGSLTSAIDNNSRINLGYDRSGRLTSSTWTGVGAAAGIPIQGLIYSLDSNGNRTSVSDATGQTTLIYDIVDRLISLTNPQGEIHTYSYNDSTGAGTLSRPGSSSTYTFDASSLISSIAHVSNGTTLSSYSLTRDSVGNLTQVATNVTSRTLAYDSDYQITSASNPETANTAMKSETFGYDSISNRTSDQKGAFTYDVKSQRLAQDYRYFYFYDNNGNLTSKQAIGLTGEVINYSYSSQNQLLKIRSYMPTAGSYNPSILWTPSSALVQEVTYLYDVMGRRVQKQVINFSNASLSLTRKFGYDGQNVLFEYDGGNSLLARYTHGLSAGDDALSVNVTPSGSAAGLAQASGSYQFIKDMLGSIVDVTDLDGNKVQHYIYSAFGELLGIQNALAADVTSNPPLRTTFGFSGREHDSESGLMYYRARYYDPNIGRFLQKDPHPGDMRVPGTIINSYVYALNNPLNRVDPSGQYSWFEGLLIGIAAAVVAVVAVVLAPIAFGVGAILSGVIEGAIVGALVGGALGIGINLAVGRPWDDQLGVAIAIGAAAGAIAGGITAALTGAAEPALTAAGNYECLAAEVTASKVFVGVGISLTIAAAAGAAVFPPAGAAILAGAWLESIVVGGAAGVATASAIGTYYFGKAAGACGFFDPGAV